MGIEKTVISDKKVTHSGKGKHSHRPSEKQAELPLRRSPATRPSGSKVLFQLKSELNRLQQRDKEWKLMFQMLSHDLKEPLVTLEGFTKLLEEEPTDPKDQKRYLRIVREAINSLHSLVGSLQSVSRLSAPPNEMVDVSLAEILSNVCSNLSEKIQRTKGEVQVICPESLVIKGDPVRVFQIFLNLISNSLKFHKKETAPRIRIEAKRSGDFVRVTIADNGIGMSSDDLKKIFEPFLRLEIAQGSTEGMGMGLSIVKRIAESLGGKVLVKSQPEVGTTFTVLLLKDIPTKGSNRGHKKS